MNKGLVLARREGESIVLRTGREVIRVQVFDTHGSGPVRLRVIAPRHVQINREEVDLEKFGGECDESDVAVQDGIRSHGRAQPADGA